MQSCATGHHRCRDRRSPGQATDHYDPVHKRLALSSDNYHGTSLAALGVAAHESERIQQKVGYAMMECVRP